MSKDEKGFLDWLVDDICSSIEIRAAVEASRDENGRVDKWKASGMAMGMGHTSDHDMAMLAGFLGAEGAFDDDLSRSYSPRRSSRAAQSSPLTHGGSKALNDPGDMPLQRNDGANGTAAESHYHPGGGHSSYYGGSKDTIIGTNLVSAEDMSLLHDSGYDELDLEMMDPYELREAMEDAGVDTFMYDFD